MLRTHKLGEADRIVTLLTRHHGRVRAVAKGVRKTTSRWGSRLEPFTHVDLQLAVGRNLDIVTQAETIEPFAGGLGGDYARYTAGTVMLETADRLVTEEGQPAVQQFLLLVGGLRAMAAGDKGANQVLDSYLLRSLAVAGYAPSFSHCARCGDEGPHRSFSPSAGGALCADCRVPGSASPSAGTLEVLGALLAGDWEIVGAADPRALAGGVRAGVGVPALAPGARAALDGVRRAVSRRAVRPPTPHPSGARPPAIPRELVPKHVAIVMDGNGRWAKQRGLPRTRGHEMGEHSLFDVVEGAIEIGVKAISAYAFSTENWTRSPDEVKFLMGFNRDVIRRRRDEMNELGVRVRWAGRAPRLWKSVIRELQVAEELTASNTVLTLTMCVNYGGRAELADTARSIAQEVAAGRLSPDKVDERIFARHLYVPEVGDADMIWRTSGEQRLSNFMLWQAAYAELVFTDVLWPDCNRIELWKAIELYAQRDRRYGKA